MAFESRTVVLVVHEARAEVELQREPVIDEPLVDAQQGVGIEVVVVHLVVEVVAVLRCEEGVRRGVDLARVVHRRIVGPDAAHDADPVGDVPLERGVEGVARRRVLEELAIDHPPRVLDAGDEFQRPELFLVSGRGVVTFVNLVFADVVAAREEIDGDQRVVVETLHQRIARILAHVGGAQVERQLVLDELGRVAHREVIAVVDVVGNRAARVERSGREIGLVALRAARDRDGVGGVESRLEEVARIVGGRRVELRAPAHRRGGGARAVGVLEVGHHERGREGGVVREVHADASCRSFLRRDEDDAVGALRTVERGGRRAREHRHGLDVLRIEVGDAFEVAAVGGFVDAFGLRRPQVGHRDAVDDVQCVVVAADRLHAPHHHARGTARSGGACVDLQSGDLTGQRIDEVGVLDRIDHFAADFLDVVCQRFLLLPDAEGRHDHRVEHLVLLLQDDLQGLPRHGNFQRLVADQRDDEYVARPGLRQDEVAVHIDGRAGRRAFDDDAGADQSYSLSVSDGAGNSPPPLGARGRLRNGFFREDDVFVLDRVGDVRTVEESVQHGRQRLVCDVERDAARPIDVGVIIDERIPRLLPDGAEHFRNGFVLRLNGYAERLRLGCGLRAGKSEQQHRYDEQTAEPCARRTVSPACCRIRFFHWSKFRLRNSCGEAPPRTAAFGGRRSKFRS